MEIRIPIKRSNILELLLTAITALIRGDASLRFKADEVNGKTRPVILDRDELASFQQSYKEAAANAVLLREMIEAAIASCPPELINDPAVLELKDSLNTIDKRALH